LIRLKASTNKFWTLSTYTPEYTEMGIVSLVNDLKRVPSTF